MIKRPELDSNLKRRNWATLGAIVAFAVLLFVVSILKMKGQ